MQNDNHSENCQCSKGMSFDARKVGADKFIKKVLSLSSGMIFAIEGEDSVEGRPRALIYREKISDKELIGTLLNLIFESDLSAPSLRALTSILVRKQLPKMMEDVGSEDCFSGKCNHN